MPRTKIKNKDINLKLELSIDGDDYHIRAKIIDYRNLSSQELKTRIKDAVRIMGKSQIAALNQRMKLSHA